MLKSKHKKKLLSFISDDDRSKFKSFVKKYNTDLDTIVNGQFDRLVHQVCLKGAESILRYRL